MFHAPLYTNKFNVSRCFLFIFRGRGWPNIYYLFKGNINLIYRRQEVFFFICYSHSAEICEVLIIQPIVGE